jgi:hypothetical protein
MLEMRTKKKVWTEQRSLFPPEGNGVEDRVSHNHIHVRKSTFIAGLSASVHRWFRLTPSYSPDLVQKMLADMQTSDDMIVLDPFSGAGTTVIEAKMEGIRSVGFEINPLLHFVCETSTCWHIPIADLQAAYRHIGERFHAERKHLDGVEVEQAGIKLPAIHNVFRWWRRDVLKDLLILREAIDHACPAGPVRSFFRLSLAGVLVPDLTNVTLGRLQLHSINRDAHDLDVWRTYHSHTERMLEDMASIPDENRGVPAEVLHIDSTTDAVLQVHMKIDRIITSPPYPNRYSYVWNTRPHLYILGLFQNARQASDLDLRTIGGTWGTATSALMKGVVEPAYPVIEKEVGPVAEQIRKDDNLMANYLVHYFNRLAAQIVSQDRILAKKARSAYVVGCSRLKGVYVETDVLLGKVFEGLGLGFKTERIERIRKRHSDRDLHESIVYASR